jgi:acetyl-CoA carboxylase carboxyltransferase component
MDAETRLRELERKHRELESGGGEEKVARQHQQGKLTAWERIQRLTDEGSFLELDEFARCRSGCFGLDRQLIPRDGVITGVGTIGGRRVALYSQDFTVLGGSLGEMHAQKIVKVMDLAVKLGIPFIGLNDSGGARIQEGIDSLYGYGEIFYRNTRASGVIPQIAVNLGPTAGGAVYSPAIMDFVIMSEQATMYITGPNVVKAVMGEEVSHGELGGGAVHNQQSGVAHFLAENDEAAIQTARRLLSYLPDNYLQEPPRLEAVPLAPDAALRAALPSDPGKGYDVHALIGQIVDGGEFLEVQSLFARNMVVGFGRIGGRAVGVVANQARYLPGVQQEHGGVIRHGAKLLFAYSEATVPKVTLILRKAYGGAYIAMCSRHLGADMVFAYPGAEIAVMGAEGAAEIIFKKEIASAADPDAARQEKIREYHAQFSNPYRAAERGYVDAVIDPADTRPVVGRAFELLRSKSENPPEKRHGNIPL